MRLLIVDDHPVKAEKPVYWAVNKPIGYLCTNDDPAGRPRAVEAGRELEVAFEQGARFTEVAQDVGRGHRTVV